ncbi:MAG: hypothetical protein SLAVMIC_00636 [uncultured marine phage]|uniref:Uncharacterized protein n=1 Tax=uncultured marine phage TaxID=707152 RepID=A0A8D9C993_9VIRU|nr:MAG: hypothetical protein SLAVMIC_00636 [uncultured marine phage]
MASKSEKINFLINPDTLPDLVRKLTDLTKISDIIKFKIDSKNILIYSLVGETTIIAFKNYLLPTKDYFDFKEEFDYTLDYIVINAKRFVKNLAFFSTEDPVKMTLTYRQSPTESLMYVRSMSASDGRFKMNNVGAEPYKVRDIDKVKLKALLNPANSEWGFQVKDSDFQDVRKLSAINGDDRIITITTNKGNIHFGEVGIWDLIISETEEVQDEITFPKKYLSSITNTEDVINFSVFPNFILFKEDNTNLMVSFEQNFEDEEY